VFLLRTQFACKDTKNFSNMQIYFLATRVQFFLFLSLISPPVAGELTRISCELLFATILHQRRYGEYAVCNYKLFSSFCVYVRAPLWCMRTRTGAKIQKKIDIYKFLRQKMQMVAIIQ